MNFEVHRMISADHPSLVGHFPGMPIVPGVVILDEVLAALTEWHENSRVTAIHSVKFLVPLEPEQPFTISLSEDHSAEAKVNFCCLSHNSVIAKGRLQICYATS